MDTRFWGPSAWKLMHLVAYNYPEKPNKEDMNNYGMFYNNLKYILPCKYCRISLANFMEELPIEKYIHSRRKLTEWVYLIHNKVNNKLRKEKLNDKPDPTLKFVDEMYESLKSDILPGWDFIYSVAFTYPEARKNVSFDKMQHYITFFQSLGNVMPCMKYRTLYNKYYVLMPINDYINCGTDLTKWLYEINCKINGELLKKENDTYSHLCQVMTHNQTFACTKTTDKGITCRKKKVKSILPYMS